VKSINKIWIVFFILISVNLFSQNFPYKSFDVNDGLSTNYVYGVVQDSKGNIWAYTERGINKFDGYQWTNYFPNRDIIKAVVTDQGKICALDYNRQSYLIEDGNIFTNESGNRQIIDLSAHGNECICIGNGPKMYQINKDTLEELEAIKTYNLYNDFGATRIASDNNQIYLYTHINNPNLIRLFSHTENSYKEIDLSGFNHKGKRDFIMTYLNNRVLLFNENTLLILNDAFDLIRSIDLSLMKDFSDTEILNPYFDNNGNLWIGTRSKGLIFISKQDLGLSFINHPKSTNIDFQEIGALDQKIVLANNTGDFYYLQNDTLHSIYSSSYKHIHRFFKHTNTGRFFFKNSRDDLLEYNFKTQQFFEHEHISLRVKNLFFDEAKDLYTLSYTDGEIIERSNLIDDLENSIAKLQGHTLFKNKESKLLVANLDSLRYLDALDDVIVTLGKPNEIATLNELDQGRYLLGTNENGFYSYNINTQELNNYLAGKSIVKIRLFDDQVFIVCVDGVYILNNQFDILEEIHFNSDLVGNDIYKSNDSIYIATSKGLLRAKMGLQTKLQDTTFDFRSIEIFNGNNSITNNSELAYDENNISITHPLMHLGSFNKVVYEYRLLPIQKEWTTTKDVTTYFYDLDPNDYIFEIRGIDVYDNIHLPNQEISFRILKPYYKQSWFLVLLFFAFLLSYYLLNLITKNIEHQKHKIESSYVKRITELKLQALQAQMNPHFVFNSIGSIQYYIQTENILNAEKYLLKFSNLIRYYINNSKEHFSELKNEINLLECYMDLENMRLEDAFDYAINVDKGVSLESAIPSMILQPLIDNLINESYTQNSDHKYALELRIKNAEDGLMVEIINDGNRISLFNNNKKRTYINGAKNMEFLRLKVDILNEVFDLNTTFEELPLNDGGSGNHIVIEFKKAHKQEYATWVE